MKLVGSNETSASEPRKKPVDAIITKRRCFSDHAATPTYQSSRRLFSGSPLWCVRKRAASIGVIKPRDGQRREHGHHRGPAELFEDEPRNAAHHRRWEEHGDERHAGGDDRETDLGGRIHRRLQRRFAAAQMPHDVLDLDDRVVDEQADHERQREQRDGVHREAEPVHRRERRDDRQRQRRGRYQRRAPVAQEQPDDGDREDARLPTTCSSTRCIPCGSCPRSR